VVLETHRLVGRSMQSILCRLAVSGNIGSNHCLFDAGVARSNTDDARPVLIGLSVRHGR
jgi:hypothetical protein